MTKHVGRDCPCRPLVEVGEGTVRIHHRLSIREALRELGYALRGLPSGASR